MQSAREPIAVGVSRSAAPEINCLIYMHLLPSNASGIRVAVTQGRRHGPPAVNESKYSEEKPFTNQNRWRTHAPQHQGFHSDRTASGDYHKDKFDRLNIKPPHESWTLVNENDSYIDISMRVKINSELRNIIYKNSPGLEVISPESFRKTIKKEINKAYSYYTNL